MSGIETLIFGPDTPDVPPPPDPNLAAKEAQKRKKAQQDASAQLRNQARYLGPVQLEAPGIKR